MKISACKELHLTKKLRMRLVQPLAYPYLFDLKTITVFFLGRGRRKNGSLNFDRDILIFSPPFKISATVLLLVY
jgi:hypothetical protein